MTSEFHAPLSGERRLRFLAEACLAVRGGEAACQACASACPVAALKVGADGTAIIRDCLGCGRCKAACPSGALAVAGFHETALPIGKQPLTIECWKVPAAVAGPHSIAVPCLGGISLGQLLQWLLAAGERGLTLVDRGGCARCSAGGGDFAGLKLLDEVGPWLEDCGLPRSRWPGVEMLPLPVASMPAAIPAPEARIAMSRRGFFGRLGREIARGERPSVPPAGARAALRARACPLPAREQLLAAIAELAARHGRPVPGRAWPAVRVDDRCRDHGLCAGVCPTGALVRTEHGADIRLEFAAARCVACRRCEVACPERALALSPAGGSAEPMILVRHEAGECIECGRRFARRGDVALCPACQSRQILARSLFGHG